MQRISDLFLAGVGRVVIGSSAANDKEFLQEALLKYGDKIIVGADAMNGDIKTSGWTKPSGINYLDFCKELDKAGVKTIVFTDISKDGTLDGVNIDALSALQSVVSCDIIASGGVRDMRDIDALLGLRVYGAICGKSIYSGTLSLKEAIARTKR